MVALEHSDMIGHWLCNVFQASCAGDALLILIRLMLVFRSGLPLCHINILSIFFSFLLCYFRVKYLPKYFECESWDIKYWIKNYFFWNEHRQTTHANVKCPISALCQTCQAITHFNHFYCIEICDKLSRDLAMVTYIYLNVDECWLTSSMFKLQMLLNYAVIPENVVSED